MRTEIQKEMQKTLPPAATAGYAYDYQSVMHYPWMQIKDGVTNTMYPVWVSFFYTDINYFRLTTASHWRFYYVVGIVTCLNITLPLFITNLLEIFTTFSKKRFKIYNYYYVK